MIHRILVLMWKEFLELRRDPRLFGLIIVAPVVQLGVPWRTRRSPAGARGQTQPGQQWLYLVAQDSLDGGLFDTLDARLDLPRTLVDGGRGFLQGERLSDWLLAVQAVVQAIAVPTPQA